MQRLTRFHSVAKHVGIRTIINAAPANMAAVTAEKVYTAADALQKVL